MFYFRPPDGIDYRTGGGLWRSGVSFDILDPMQLVRRAQVLGLALAGLLSTACDEEGALTQLAAEAVFEPSSVDFGQVAPGSARALPVILRNVGQVTLTVEDVQIPADFSLRGLARNLVGAQLAPGESIGFDLTFLPRSEGLRELVLVAAFDREEAEAQLTIRADGSLRQAPLLSVSPSPVDFGTQSIDFTARRTVTIRNDGSANALIESVGRASDRSDATQSGLYVLDATLPIAVNAGQQANVDVLFTPPAAATYTETLEFRPAGLDPLLLDVRGRGSAAQGNLTCTPPTLDFGAVERGATNTLRVVCSATGGAVSVTSAAPEEGTHFRLTQNTGSSEIAPGTPLELDVVFEAQGPVGGRSDFLVVSYRASTGSQDLRVRLSGSVSEPSATETAISLELSWNTDNTDVDLHLTGPGGAPFVFNDCFFNNSQADWGVPGDPSDDCFLDQDDVDGFGPERINVGRAEAGLYRVYIHYFADNGFGRSTASVTVTLGGQTVGQFSRPNLVCNDLWHVGDIQWNGQTGTFRQVDRIDFSNFGRCN